MAPRGSTRQRGGVKSGSSAQADGFLDAPAPLSPRDATEQKDLVEAEEDTSKAAPAQGISILKEIFPEHGLDQDKCGGKAPSLAKMLQLPSPARAAPFGPPAHAPMPLVAPVGPPPPPLLAPSCQEQMEPPRAAAPAQVEQGFSSYRERLRAGGRGAFQRAIGAGLMPKNMKQEWNGMQMQSPPAQCGLSQQTKEWASTGMTMPYGGVDQMWSGAGQMQSNDYCGVPMPTQYPCVQQVPMQMLPQMAMQQPTMQMVPMAQGEQSPQMHMPQMQMSQMQMPQMPMQQMQMPQMGMSPVQTPTASGQSTPTGMQTPVEQQIQMQMQMQMQTQMQMQMPTPTASGESTPTGMQTPAESVRSECMAMLMPQGSQVTCDMLAAQLQASAESQNCYED